MLVACGMQRCHQEALKKNRVTLAKELVLKELLEHMIEKDIITTEMVEMIQAKSGSFSQNIEFLNLLPKRGPNAFSAFCEALRETKQQHLEAAILRTLSNLSHGIVRLEHCYGSDLPFPASELCHLKKPRWIEQVECSLNDGGDPSVPPVKYCTPEFYKDHQHLAYRLVSEPRGLALIISNVHFSSEQELEDRAGGDVDCTSLQVLFKHLGYQVTVCHDQTAQDMQKTLERFSKLPDHQGVDSCIVALLSHGVEGAVYGSDGKLLQLQEAFRLFDNANCPNLQNKPKMFFIQACRGGVSGTHTHLLPCCCHCICCSVCKIYKLRTMWNECNKPEFDETDRGVDQRDGKEWSSCPGCEQADANKEESPRLRLPTCSDMICGYACLKGTAAMRNTKRGSWYIEALTAVFAEDSRDTHVADMLVKVNRQIKHREGYAPGTEFHRCKEMSEYCSTLCQDLYLFPGYVPGK